MAPSFDSTVSSLLCAEDNSSILDDTEYEVEEETVVAWHHRSLRSRNHQEQSLGPTSPVQSDDSVALMVAKECQHLPIDGYLNRLRTGALDMKTRVEAVDWMSKVHAHFNFGPLCAYLSINYLDRFLSAYELPKGKAWIVQLLAVACLSIAAKMEETQVPVSVDLQVGESRFIFEAKTIQRMELLVLSTLKWRMQAVTPFSFLNYFLQKLLTNEKPLPAAIACSTEFILGTIKGIDFLEFRPSEIAAAVAMSVAGKSYTAMNTDETVSLLTQHVQKERMLKCAEMIHDLLLISGGSSKGLSSGSVSSVPQSPVGVLDAACLSYKSHDTTVGPCATSSPSTQTSKRRKLNRSLETEFREI